MVQKNNPGIGWAYREGMAGGRGKLRRSDGRAIWRPSPPPWIAWSTKIVKTGCDGVIANRWLPGGGFTNYDPLKYVLNWIFQKMFKALFWTELGDLTFGFKILSKEMTQSIDWQGTLHEICIETTVKPIKKGYRMEQIPSVGWAAKKAAASIHSSRISATCRLALETLVSRRAARPI